MWWPSLLVCVSLGFVFCLPPPEQRERQVVAPHKPSAHAHHRPRSIVRRKMTRSLLGDFFKWNAASAQPEMKYEPNANKTGYEQGQCPDGQFVCKVSAHPPLCLPLTRWCDNVFDCPGKEDESQCDQVFPCPANHLVCDGGVLCLTASDRCNGFDDCQDGSDEHDCVPRTALNPAQANACPPGRFKCKMGPCVTLDAICDGFTDCPHRDDEENCPVVASQFNCAANKFQCESTGVCIELDWQCDGMQDCSDGSDERYCRGNVRLPSRDSYSASHFVECTKEQFRCTSGATHCIARNKVCDEYSNCEDGSDEGQFCGACEHYGCEHACLDGPLGPECACDLGMQLQTDGRSCADVDECSLGLHDCDQVCVNLPNSFHCTCLDGFTLLADDVSCELDDQTTGALIVLTQRHVRLLPLVSSAHSSSVHESMELPTELGQPVHASLMSGGQALPQLVVSALYNGGDNGALWLVQEHDTFMLVNNLPDVSSVVVDRVVGNIYFTVRGSGAYSGVSVCSANGRFCRLLVSDKRLSHVRGLALDEQSGRMFWASEGERVPVLRCALMDGTESQVLVTDKLSAPSALTFDPARNRLYWADSAFEVIESLDLKSMHRALVVSSGVHLPSDVRVFGNRVFWTEQGSNALISDNAHSTNNQPHIEQQFADTPLAVLVQHSSLQAQLAHVSNPCVHARCLHLCVIVPGEHGSHANVRVNSQVYRLCAECVCPNGYVYSKSLHECILHENSSLVHVHAPTLAAHEWLRLCHLQLACLNQGHCQPRGNTQFCLCADGFSGVYCEVDLNPSNAEDQGGLGAGTAFIIVLSVIVVLAVLLLVHKRKDKLISSTLGLKQHVVAVARYSRANGVPFPRQRVSSVRQTLLSKSSDESSLSHSVASPNSPNDCSFGNPLYSDAAWEQPQTHPKAIVHDNDSGISHNSHGIDV